MSTVHPKSTWIMVDVRQLPIFRGYLFCWCYRAYWFFYWSLLKRTFKTIKVGNITESFMNIFKGFVYAQRLVVQNLNKERLLAVQAYDLLSSQPS
jgi:hypothetical protein